MYVVTTQNSFYSCILGWGWDVQKVKKPAALFFLPSSATQGHERRSKDYSFFLFILNLILQWKWTLFIESFYLIGATGKLIHVPQVVRKAWLFSFLLELKVCSGEGWCASLLMTLSYCCANPAQCTLVHAGDKISILPPHLCGVAQHLAHCYRGFLPCLRVSVLCPSWDIPC